MANIDYSKSAVRLTNPSSVRDLLVARCAVQGKLGKLQGELNEKNKELIEKIGDTQKILVENEAEIRAAIDSDGSFQDLNTGLYGVKQQRVSYAYDPCIFWIKYPKYAPSVIKQVVDTAELGGLIKGKLITMEDLLLPFPPTGLAAATEKLSYGFIIKVGE